MTLIILSFILNACGPRGHRMGDHRRRHQQGLGMGNDRRPNNPGMRNRGRITSVCSGKNDLSKIIKGEDPEIICSLSGKEFLNSLIEINGIERDVAMSILKVFENSYDKVG